MSNATKYIYLPDRLDFKKFEEDFLKKFNEKKYADVDFDRIVFDFSKTKYVDLMEIMCLSVAADHLIKEKKCKCRFNFPKENHIREFLQDWNLIDILSKKGSSNLDKEIEGIKRYKIYKIGRFLPVTSIKNSKDLKEIKKDLANKIKRNFSELSSEARNSFCDKILYEVCQNILDHAYDKDGQNKTALLGMSSYPNLISEMKRGGEKDKEIAKYKFGKLPFWLRDVMSKEREAKSFLELVVVDGGKGFLKNLKIELRKRLKDRLKKRGLEDDPMPWEINDENALRSVFIEGGISTHPDKKKDPRRGYGLYWVLEHVKTWGGCIYIRTGKCVAVISSDSETSYQERKYPFPGVQYRIFLPLSDKDRELEVLKQKQKQWEQEKIKL